MTPPHPEPLQLVLEEPTTISGPVVCKNGHSLTPDNIYRFKSNGRIYSRCRRCSLDQRKRYREGRLGRKTRVRNDLRALILIVPAEITPLEAWVNRKRRERNDEPLTLADREQVTEQMEDL